MSRYLVITSDWRYVETDNPPLHDHYSYDYKTDIYYEKAPYNQMSTEMTETLKNYGIM